MNDFLAQLENRDYIISVYELTERNKVLCRVQEKDSGVDNTEGFFAFRDGRVFDRFYRPVSGALASLIWEACRWGGIFSLPSLSEGELQELAERLEEAKQKAEIEYPPFVFKPVKNWLPTGDGRSQLDHQSYSWWCGRLEAIRESKRKAVTAFLSSRGIKREDIFLPRWMED